jgi:hypothetical protein
MERNGLEKGAIIRAWRCQHNEASMRPGFNRQLDSSTMKRLSARLAAVA